MIYTPTSTKINLPHFLVYIYIGKVNVNWDSQCLLNTCIILYWDTFVDIITIEIIIDHEPLMELNSHKDIRDARHIEWATMEPILLLLHTKLIIYIHHVHENQFDTYSGIYIYI